MSDTITATALDRLRDLLDRLDTDSVQGVFKAYHPDQPSSRAYPFMFGVLRQRALMVVGEADRNGGVRNVKVNLTSGTHPKTGCTARLKVDGQTVTCVDHDELSRYPHSTGPLAWGDEAPGAVPHHDPKPPRYHAVPGVDGDWGVEAFTDTDAWLVAEFAAGHPNPEGAAEAEAARLNGEYANAHDAYGQVQAERDRYQAALRKIADSPYWHEADFYAHRVLDGGQP